MSIAHDLYDVVDFDALFQGTLISELQNPAPQYKVVKRRVIWLIGQWVSINFDQRGDKGLRRGLYEAILHLLNPTQDMVVRITASVTLKSTINDFGFKTADFLPFLDKMVTSLFQLLHDVVQCQTKMRVLDVVTLLFGEQIGKHMQVHADTLAKYLPTLWSSCDDSSQVFKSLYFFLFDFLTSSLPFLVGLTLSVQPRFDCNLLQCPVGTAIFRNAWQHISYYHANLLLDHHTRTHAHTHTRTHAHTHTRTHTHIHTYMHTHTRTHAHTHTRRTQRHIYISNVRKCSSFLPC